jgi:hypothetical protein
MRRALFLVFTMAAILCGESRIDVTLIGTGTTGPFQLGRKNLLIESEQVFYRGALLINQVDYQVNYGEGYLVFAHPIPINDTIRVSFAVVPLSLKTEYNLMRPLAANLNDSLTLQQPIKSPSEGNSELNLIGSQRFIVNIGNTSEPALTQSLDLNITGQLAPQVSIRGSISDRNFDNVSGSTSSLDELDKILLHLDTPNARADFGDLELVGVENSLLDFRRKLTGITIQAEKSDYSGATELAFSPGQQIEMFFFGIDGRQGPYFINATNSAPSNNQTSNRFLAGTEEIYLDGRKLSRGNENDYTIDYYQGYLEFTPKNIISSRNRITVKIQAADVNYRRTFLHGKAFANKGIIIGAQYIREGDDKSRPRVFDIGQPQSELLSRVGANADSAFLSGASYVGLGQGSYNLQIDSLGDTVYIYTGPDSGFYNVSFSYIGAGKGAYQYSGAGKYVFVGKGNGGYSPLIYYPLPQRNEYGSIIIRRDGLFFANTELAISNIDRNTMSVIDKRQTGVGFYGQSGLRIKNRSVLGKAWNGDVIELTLRSLSSEFGYPGSINPVEFSRQYNLPDINSSLSGQLIEIRSSARASEGDYFDIGGGRIVRDSLTASRGYGKLGYVVFDWLLLSTDIDIARAENSVSGIGGWWNKYEGGAKSTDSKLRPSIVFRHELKSNLDTLSANYRANEFEAELGWSISDKLNTSGKAIIRNQDYGAPNRTFWRKQYNQTQIEHRLNYNKEGVSIETNLGRLYQNASYPELETTSRNLGSLKIGYSTSTFDLTFYENVNGTARVLQAREYIYVGKGKGDYRRDGNDYVAEPGGEYVEIIRQAIDQTVGESGYQVSGGLRLRYDGFSTGNGRLSGFSCENDLNFQQYLLPRMAIAADQLLPFGRFKPDELSYRNYNYRQKLKYRPNKRDDYISHTLTVSQNKGSRYQLENLESNLIENAIDTKVSAGKRSSILFFGKLAFDKQTLYSGKVDVERYRVGATPDYQIADNLRLSSLIDILREKERVRNLVVHTYSIGPKVIGVIINAVRIECEFGYSSVLINREESAIPYVLADNKKSGDNYNLILNGRFKLSRNGNMTISYSYKKLGDGYYNYNLRAEARAEF